MHYFFLLLIFFSPPAKAQPSYNVVFKYVYDLNSPEARANFEEFGYNIKLRMVCNSTMSYWYPILDGKDPMKRSRKKFGEKLINKGTYFIKEPNLAYSTVNLTSKEKFLYTYENKEYDWEILAGTKIIQGYKCKAALSVTEAKDSLLVFYIEDSGISGSPYHIYNGVPGIVTELFDQKRKLHFLATEIKKDFSGIMLPKDVETVTEDEMLRRMAARRKKLNE